MKNIEIKKLPDSEIEITGEISAETFEGTWDEAVKNISQKVKLDGFRPGSVVPEKVLADKVGEIEILEEAAQISMKKAYPEILIKHKIEAIGEPEIVITKLARKNPLGFKIKTAVIPEISLPDYKKIASELIKNKEIAEVEEKEVDAAIDYLKKSEEKRNTLPETDENNKPEIKVNDEFAKRFGEFENLDALKKRLRENIKQDKQIKLKDKKRAEILDAISKESKIEYPKILLDAELSKMTGEIKENLSGMGISWENYLEHIKKKEEDLAKEWEKEADRRVRYGLTLRQIAITENIQIAPEELEKEVELIMSRYQAEDKSKLDRQRLEDYAYGILRNERVFIALETSEVN